MSQHQRMFHSIVINLEEQNKEMMSKLRGMQSQDTTAAGEGMQMQLNRLKSLMETIFSGKEGRGGGEPRAGSVSLSEPSMVESTPLPRQDTPLCTVMVKKMDPGLRELVHVAGGASMRDRAT